MTPARESWPTLKTPVGRLGVLLAAVLGILLLRLSLGTVHLPPLSIARALAGLEPGVPASIVNGFRVPRALAAILAGAAMAVSGLQMQTLLRNPLAGPWILGVVGCARLGVAALLTLGPVLGFSLATTLGPLASGALTIAAISGAAAGMLAIAALSRRISPITLLITGVIATYIADSAANLLVILAPLSQKAIFTAWNDGSFESVAWPQLKIFLAVGSLALFASAGLLKVLDALVLGDRYARSLGHSVARSRYAAVLGIVALAGSVTAFCGPIAFLDVAIPHVARALFRTADHKTLMPATALMGAFVALAADLATSLPGAQQVLHINHVTAILGGPIILWVLLSRKQSREMQF
jgi:iron complex transport system permease protein